MKTGVGMLLLIGVGCGGASASPSLSSRGPITGSPRPGGIYNSETDPTGGDIEMLAVGGAFENVHNRPTNTEREVIRRAAREELGAIVDCYQQELRNDPALSGTVDLRFIINFDGRVDNTTMEAYGLHMNVATCVREIVRSIWFPPPAVPLRVDFPFTFRPVLAEPSLADTAASSL
jgi:hypothetical protein